MGWYGESQENPTPPEVPGGISTVIGVLLILCGVGWFIVFVVILLYVNFIAGCTVEEALSVINLLDVVGSISFVIVGAGLLLYSKKNGKNNT